MLHNILFGYDLPSIDWGAIWLGILTGIISGLIVTYYFNRGERNFARNDFIWLVATELGKYAYGIRRYLDGNFEYVLETLIANDTNYLNRKFVKYKKYITPELRDLIKEGTQSMSDATLTYRHIIIYSQLPQNEVKKKELLQKLGEYKDKCFELSNQIYEKMQDGYVSR